MARTQLEGINDIEGISFIKDMAIRESMSMSMSMSVSRPTVSKIMPLKGQAKDLRLGLAVAGLAARRSRSRQGREDIALWFGLDSDSGWGLAGCTEAPWAGWGLDWGRSGKWQRVRPQSGAFVRGSPLFPVASRSHEGEKWRRDANHSQNNSLYCTVENSLKKNSKMPVCGFGETNHWSCCNQTSLNI